MAARSGINQHLKKKSRSPKGDNINSSQVVAIYSQALRYETDLLETGRGNARSIPGRKQKGD